MWDWIAELDELRRAGVPAVLVTVVECSGSTPREVGARMVVRDGGRPVGTIGGGQLERVAIEEALRCLAERRSRLVRYPLGPAVGQCCGGVVDVFMDVINTGPKLYVFGAGHVGQALCRVLAGTPFELHLIDEREEWLAAAELPASVTRHTAGWDMFVREAQWSAESTYAVVMSHSHDLDEEILRELAPKPTRYLGLIGSATKWARFQKRLAARGVGEELLARVRCPIGLDLGGKAPQEVAISAAAELLKVHHGR